LRHPTNCSAIWATNSTSINGWFWDNNLLVSVTNGVFTTNGSGFASGQAITNMYFTNVNIDFGSASVGAQVTQNVPWTGVTTNCSVTVTPSPVFNTIIGTWQGTATNDIVQVRFVPTAAAQDPPAGIYTIKVEQFR